MKVMLRIASKTTLLLASAFMTNYIGSDAVEVANHKGKEYIRDESKSAVSSCITDNLWKLELNPHIDVPFFTIQGGSKHPDQQRKS